MNDVRTRADHDAGTFVLDQTEQHVHIAFATPHRVLSSAVLGGGMVDACHILNLNVPQHDKAAPPNPLPSPEATLSDYAVARGWSGTTVGMMTAASMKSLRVAERSADGCTVTVLATAGLSNPRRAGDHADIRSVFAPVDEIGTINLAVVSSAHLSAAAMMEAAMVATEAKAAALQTADVRSAVSGEIATGTGTDSMAIACPPDGRQVRYCGKHVLFGQMLGEAVIDAVSASVSWDLHKTGPL